MLAKEVGADPDSVEWTNVEPQLRESLLAQGSADGISCFSITCLPVLNQKLGLPPEDLNVFYYNDHGLDLYGNALIVRKDFLEAHPEVVQGFVAAIDQVVEGFGLSSTPSVEEVFDDSALPPQGDRML